MLFWDKCQISILFFSFSFLGLSQSFYISCRRTTAVHVKHMGKRSVNQDKNTSINLQTEKHSATVIERLLCYVSSPSLKIIFKTESRQTCASRAASSSQKVILPNAALHKVLFTTLWNNTRLFISPVNASSDFSILSTCRGSRDIMRC